MRYRFKGLSRATGKALEGHVEAFSEEEALSVLSENGFVTESLREDPVPLPPATPPQPVQGRGTYSAIDSALDSSSTQVPFDNLVNRYKGKSVWVIDRDKIRRNVAEVVDGAMAQSAKFAEGEAATRARVAQAIDGLFRDNRNITSQANQVNASMERQIVRMERLVIKAEAVLAALAAAARSGGVGGGGGGNGPRRMQVVETRQEQNAVLLEIFKDNLRLRGIEFDTSTDGANGESAAEPSLTESAGTQTESETPNDSSTKGATP